MNTNKIYSVVAHVDGACSGNETKEAGTIRLGGVGIHYQMEDPKKELKIGLPFKGDTTLVSNGRMEIRAVIEALACLKKPANITIYSDSKYVVDSINKWIEGWVKRGWKKADKKAVENQDLWQLFRDIRDKKCLDFKINWIPREQNQIANDLAQAACQSQKESMA